MIFALTSMAFALLALWTPSAYALKVPGFFQADTRGMNVQRSKEEGYTQVQVTDQAKTGMVMFQALPKGRATLQQLTSTYGARMTRRFGTPPNNQWIRHEGVKMLRMTFNQHAVLWFANVDGGILVVILATKSTKSPVYQMLQALQLDHPIARRFRKNKRRNTKKPANTPQGKIKWICKAKGIYQVCRKQPGSYVKHCQYKGAQGLKGGPTRAVAAAMARTQCMTHMTNMIIISNMSGAGSVHQTCRVVRCYQP